MTDHDQGKYDKACKLQERILELRKKLSGEEHLQTVTAMGHLALTYGYQGKHKEACELQERVLTVEEVW